MGCSVNNFQPNLGFLQVDFCFGLLPPNVAPSGLLLVPGVLETCILFCVAVYCPLSLQGS